MNRPSSPGYRRLRGREQESQHKDTVAAAYTTLHLMHVFFYVAKNILSRNSRPMKLMSRSQRSNKNVRSIKPTFTVTVKSIVNESFVFTPINMENT